MNLQKQLDQIAQFVKIPENLHPLEVANDALKMGKAAGVVKVWAQNGSVWDINFTDGTQQKAITSSVIQVVFKKVLDNAPVEIVEEVDQAADEAAADALLSSDIDPSDEIAPPVEDIVELGEGEPTAEVTPTEIEVEAHVEIAETVDDGEAEEETPAEDKKAKG